MTWDCCDPGGLSSSAHVLTFRRHPTQLVTFSAGSRTLLSLLLLLQATPAVTDRLSGQGPHLVCKLQRGAKWSGVPSSRLCGLAGAVIGRCRSVRKRRPVPISKPLEILPEVFLPFKVHAICQPFVPTEKLKSLNTQEPLSLLHILLCIGSLMPQGRSVTGRAVSPARSSCWADSGCTSLVAHALAFPRGLGSYVDTQQFRAVPRMTELRGKTRYPI